MLTRELSDGAAIVVTRRWRIGFASTDAGMTVGGEQTFAEVAAPPVLSPLAALEKARSTAGLFPIKLDRAGQITGSERGMDAAHLLRAIEASRTLLAISAGAGGVQDDARSFLAQLAGMGTEAVSRIPRDLFFPDPAPSSAAQDIVLPSGDTGRITVKTDARVHAETGLLRASERIVVTRLGTGTRVSREGWSLVPAG